MSMQNAGEYIQRTLLFWLTACSLAAFFWPDMAAVGTLDPFLSTAPAIPYQFAVTMFCIGCLLPRKEVDALAKRWPTVLGGTTIQYLSMPLLAWGVATVLGLKGPYLVGVIVVGCVPGAMASNVLTLAARGNVSYSVSLTTTATIFSPFIVPLVLKLALSHEQDIPTQKIMIALLWQVVGPVIAGHVICRTASGFAQFMRGLGPIVANGTIIWIIAVVVAKNRANLQTIFDSDGAALSLVVGLLALNILGYLAGFGGSSALGLPNGMRRALTLEIGMQNAGDFTVLPFPDFPALKQYTDGTKALLQRYPVDDFDRQKTAQIMQLKGWVKDDEGFWAEDGKRFKIVIEIFAFMMDFAPVLVEQLRQAGFDATFRSTSDSYTRMSSGHAQAFIFGHGGSVRDPYFTLRLYHSQFVQPTGSSTPNFWRWKNAEFDRIVDEMGKTDPADSQLAVLFHEALEVWLPNLPAVPLLQFYHRIPHNQTYWKNWPSETNPYINTAYWHRTFLLLLLGLQPAQK